MAELQDEHAWVRVTNGPWSATCRIELDSWRFDAAHEWHLVPMVRVWPRPGARWQQWEHSGFPVWIGQVPPPDDSPDKLLFDQCVVFGLDDDEHGIWNQTKILNAEGMRRHGFSEEVVDIAEKGANLLLGGPELAPFMIMPNGHDDRVWRNREEIAAAASDARVPGGGPLYLGPLSFRPPICTPTVSVTSVDDQGNVTKRRRLQRPHPNRVKYSPGGTMAVCAAAIRHVRVQHLVSRCVDSCF